MSNFFAILEMVDTYLEKHRLKLHETNGPFHELPILF